MNNIIFLQIRTRETIVQRTIFQVKQNQFLLNWFNIIYC